VSYKLRKGYLLNKHNDIICNLHGNYLEGSFCQPELEYILKNGEILSIQHIAIYESEILFDKYIDFFYEIKKNNSGIVREFCKKFLTNLYGKWGQLREVMRPLTQNEINDDYKEIIEDNISIITNDELCFSHIATILAEGDLYKIRDKLYIQERKKTKAFDSLIAISSYVTSSCRVYLMYLKEIAESEIDVSNMFKMNVFYCDTDSLFVNKKGFDILKERGYIGKELGQLKNELGQDKEGNEITGTAIFHAPKDYEFNEKIKCKGIKKTSKKINDNSYEVQEFESLNKAIKNDNLDCIIITTKTKIMNREYRKGIVSKNGVVTPFVV